MWPQGVSLRAFTRMPSSQIKSVRSGPSVGGAVFGVVVARLNRSFRISLTSGQWRYSVLREIPILTLTDACVTERTPSCSRILCAASIARLRVADDLFRYTVAVWMPATPEDEGALGDGYWHTERISGLFDNAEACAADARKSETWRKKY